MTEAAPAKVNLALHVTGRRPDFHHDLDTIAVFTELADTVELRPGDTPGEVRYEGVFADALAGLDRGGDLVRRAAEAILAAAGLRAPPPGVLVTKMIPVAAGLGGGSADAAAVLRLLALQHSRALRDADLTGVAATLGADVPMCLASVPLRAGGKGERITRLGGFPQLPLVLLNPRRSVATAEVFARLAAADDAPLPAVPRAFADAAGVSAWLATTRNTLEVKATEIVPEIRQCLDALASDPDCLLARMSGSGATCFGLYPTGNAASRAGARIASAEPGWWVCVTASGGSPDDVPPEVAARRSP